MGADHEKDYCFLVPILPGKADNVRRFWNEATGDRAGELDKYMRALGQTRLLEYLQALPRGNVLVTYVREEDDPASTFCRNRTLGVPVADYVREAFLGFTGIDFTAPENAPKVEKLRAWEDRESVRPASRHSAFAVPILPGKTDAVRRFFSAVDTNEKTDEETPVFRHQTVSKMASFLQHRPEGDYLLEYVESEKPLDEVMRMGLDSGKPISEFIRTGFGEFSTLPLPLAPEIELLFDWDAREGDRTSAARTAQA